MQFKNKADSWLNEPTDAPLVNLNPCVPPLADNNGEGFPKQEEALSVEPALADAFQKKRQLFPLWIILALVSVLGMGGTLLILPNLLDCTSKAKQAEGQSNVSAINRAQQAYYLEENTFTNSARDLGVGINPHSVNYDYSIRTTKTAAFHYAIARKGKLKSYVAAVFTLPNTTTTPKALTVAIICDTLHPSRTLPNAPTLVKGIPTCGSGTRDLSVPSTQFP